MPKLFYALMAVLVFAVGSVARAAEVTVVVVPGGYEPQRTYAAPFAGGNSVHWALERANERWTGKPLKFDVSFDRRYGYFITAINGFVGTPLSTWTMYLDGKFSCKGIDKATIHSGEVIRLRYELVGGHAGECPERRALRR